MPESLLCGVHWQPDLPDPRDYRIEHPRVVEQFAVLEASPQIAPSERVDLREFFPPVAEARLGEASMAHACVNLVDYFRRRAEGRLTPGSTAFVHQVARLLARQQGQSRADLRTTLKALVRFGIPPVSCQDDPEPALDGEPGPFLYGLADDLSAMSYFRLDGFGGGGEETLARVKSLLTAGFPCVLGFPVPESVSEEPDIPWRPAYDGIRGGQVVVAVGYDDRRMRWTKGALLIRNSWGRQWGEAGYGWLPYAFVQRKLAGDCWSVVNPAWLEGGEFERPAL